MSLNEVMMNAILLTHSEKESHPEKRFHVTATVVDKKYRTIAMGRNSYVKTHPMQARLAKICGNSRKIYLHAEIASLVRCRMKPYAMIICRVAKDGSNALARPCDICMMALKEAGVKEIWYTTNDKYGWNKETQKSLNTLF